VRRVIAFVIRVTLPTPSRALIEPMIPLASMAAGRLCRRFVCLSDIGARRLEAAMPIWRNAHVAVAELIEPNLIASLMTTEDYCYASNVALVVLLSPILDDALD
jgi:hypothetical protein